MKVFFGIALLACLGAGAAWAENLDRHFTIAGETLLVVNLAGEVRVEPAAGSAFEIDAAVRGSDAGADLVRFDQGEGPHAHLFVQYPMEKERSFVYPELGRGANSSFSAPRGAGWGETRAGGPDGGRRRGRQVRVRGEGRGLEAWTDVTIRVPAGKKLELRHGAGRVAAANLQADLLLDSCIGSVDVEGVRGRVSVDTGSGDVSVRDTAGDLAVDTGSGSVTLDGCSGDRINVDTGSGSVEVQQIEADNLKIDTGSGEVSAVLTRMGGGSFIIDTGSGSIRLRVPADASAEIMADTGSGGISLDLAGARLRRHGRDEAAVTLGDGTAKVRLDTGSGSIHVTH